MLPYRPLTVGDTLDGAFRLVRSRFGRVALLVLVVLGPYQLLLSFLMDRWLPEWMVAEPGEPATFELMDDETVGGLMALMGVTTVLGYVVYVLVGGALVAMVLREDAGHSATLPEALGLAVRRAWPLIAATLLVWLAALAGGLVVGLVAVLLGQLLLPVGILVGVVGGLGLLAATLVAGSLVIPVAMTERDAGGARTFGRVVSLARRRFWRFLGVLLLVLLVLVVVTLAVSMVLGILALLAGPVGWVVEGASNTLVSMVTTPVMVFTALLLYVDARVRLEGWDLTLRAQPPRPW